MLLPPSLIKTFTTKLLQPHWHINRSCPRYTDKIALEVQGSLGLHRLGKDVSATETWFNRHRLLRYKFRRSAMHTMRSRPPSITGSRLHCIALHRTALRRAYVELFMVNALQSGGVMYHRHNPSNGCMRYRVQRLSTPLMPMKSRFLEHHCFVLRHILAG